MECGYFYCGGKLFTSIRNIYLHYRCLSLQLFQQHFLIAYSRKYRQTMKILQVGKFYPIRGGVEKVMYDLTLGLSQRGVACDMLCATTEDHEGGTIELNTFAKL